jgi:hypothetical protein
VIIKGKFGGGVESEQKVPVGLTIFRKMRDGRYRKGPSGEDILTADEVLGSEVDEEGSSWSLRVEAIPSQRSG